MRILPDTVTLLLVTFRMKKKMDGTDNIDSMIWRERERERERESKRERRTL